MKEFILYVFLAGSPEMVFDYNTIDTCQSDLSRVKAGMPTSEANQYRCAARADFMFLRDVADRRKYLEWKVE